MKNVFTTALLWIGIAMSSLQAQNYSFTSDTLNILNRDELFARMITFNFDKQKKVLDYKKLLSSFTEKLEQIKSQIPDYPQYEIFYLEDKKISVEEITGTLTYQVEGGSVMDAQNRNRAILKNDELIIELFFSELTDLTSRDYATVFQNALETVPSAKKFRVLSGKNAKSHQYSYSEGKMLEKEKTTNINFTLIPAATFGWYKNKPIYETTVGAGFLFGQQRRNVFYFFAGFNWQYGLEGRGHDRATIAGIGLKLSNYFSVKAAIPLKRSDIYHDSDYRLSLSVYPYKATSVSLHFYRDNFNEELVPGVSIGFGL